MTDKPRGLGPRQLEWCRANIPAFAKAEAMASASAEHASEQRAKIGEPMRLPVHVAFGRPATVNDPLIEAFAGHRYGAIGQDTAPRPPSLVRRIMGNK